MAHLVAADKKFMSLCTLFFLAGYLAQTQITEKKTHHIIPKTTSLINQTELISVNKTDCEQNRQAFI